jgi:hypothetical protein
MVRRLDGEHAAELRGTVGQRGLTLAGEPALSAQTTGHRLAELTALAGRLTRHHAAIEFFDGFCVFPAD